MTRTSRTITNPGKLRSVVARRWKNVERNLDILENLENLEVRQILPIFQPIIHLVSAYRAMTKQQVEALDVASMKKQVVDTWEQVRENGRVIKYSWPYKTSLRDVLEPFTDVVDYLKYEEVYPDAPKPWDQNSEAVVEAFIELWLKVKPKAQERLMIECGMDATAVDKILLDLTQYANELQYEKQKHRRIASNADSVIIHTWNYYVSWVNSNKSVSEDCIVVLAAVLEPIRNFVYRIYNSLWDHRPMWERPSGGKIVVDNIIVPNTSSKRASPSSPPKLQRRSPPSIKLQKSSSPPKLLKSSPEPPKLQKSSSPPKLLKSSPKPPKLQRRSSPSIKHPILSSPPKLRTPPKLRPGECPYGKVVNPLTKKCINDTGKLARMLRMFKVIK